MTKIFFDTETTGLLRTEASPLQQQPSIIELCAIKTDDECNVIDTLNIMMKPPFPFEEANEKGKGITQITGITNAMLADKKPFMAHYREIAEFWHGAKSMVAHNISYDRGMLRFELMRCNKLLNFPWPIDHECTIEQSMSLRGHRLNLGALHEALFGEKFDGAHRAEADVMAMIKCYKKLHNIGEQNAAA